MYNPLSKILDWYLAPVHGTADAAAGTGLGVLHSRPAATDIVAHLIDTGHTPAREADVRSSFVTLYDRDATPFEEIVAFDYVDSFGLLAR
ncbi:hypothetical protein [uncultured Corynebacterium sp.]|uniref:hypothetical protein n=1 Tax=uncultured Corynebacterium sp. TaxID=159447 RepID=UPI0025E76EF7|nr:hypothetical protein [uncultured Corynebacterium sp.]